MWWDCVGWLFQCSPTSLDGKLPCLICCCHCRRIPQPSRSQCQTHHFGYIPIHHRIQQQPWRRGSLCSPEMHWFYHALPFLIKRLFTFILLRIGYWALLLPTFASLCENNLEAIPRGSSPSPSKEPTATFLPSWAGFTESKLPHHAPTITHSQTLNRASQSSMVFYL